MKNIKTISINQDGTPTTLRYNGSYRPIEHTSTDGKDYSIFLWETYYQAVDMIFPETEDLTDEQYAEAWEMALECFENTELIK